MSKKSDKYKNCEIMNVQINVSKQKNNKINIKKSDHKNIRLTSCRHQVQTSDRMWP